MRMKILGERESHVLFFVVQITLHSRDAGETLNGRMLRISGRNFMNGLLGREGTSEVGTVMLL